MRFTFLFFAVFLMSFLLRAQGSNWEVSASFSPQLNKKVSLVNAYSLTNPEDRILNQVPLGFYDTISVNGTQRIFTQGAARTSQEKPQIIPTERSFWYGAALQVHRRFDSGFDFSAGFFLNEAKYIGAADSGIIDGDEATTLYDAYQTTDRSIGTILQANYHLFPQRKITPYFGMGLYASSRLIQEDFVSHLFAGEPAILEGRNNSAIVSRENTTFNIDFMASAGVLYQLNNNWAIGFDFKTIAGTGHGLFGFQVRKRI